MARIRLALVLSATGSLELRFVSAANNNTSRILLGLVNVSNDGRTIVVACLSIQESQLGHITFLRPLIQKVQLSVTGEKYYMFEPQ